MNKTKKTKKQIVRFRHRAVFKIFRYLLWPFFVVRYRFKYKKNKLAKEGPFLIISNHSCAIDPILMAYSFNFPIYYVSSEQIFNLGFVTKLLKFLVSPISKSKSIADISTIKNIKKTINEGGSIGMFVEGNVPYNGENPKTPEAIGKLIKHLKIPVIFYNFHGLYLSDPRWSVYRKYGPTWGEIKRIFFPAEYVGLTEQEIYQIVLKELYVNAYLVQKEKKYRYRGKNRAEGLERFLFVCPRCRSLKTLTTKGHEVNCHHCGLKAEYLESGFLNSRDVNITTLIEWDKMQIKTYFDFLNSNHDYEITDEIFLYNSLTSPKEKMGSAQMTLNQKGLTIKNDIYNLNFTYEEIKQVSIQGKHKLIVYTEANQRWLLDGRKSFNPYQYLLTFQYYKQYLMKRGIKDENFSGYIFGL